MTNRENRQLKKIKKGDKEALEQLFHLYYAGLCNYAESLLHKPEVAEEVVQDVFFNIWKNRTKLELHTGWQSYLFRAVYNNAMMHIRKAKREMSLDEHWAQQQLLAGDNPGDAMELRDLQAAILFTMGKLPARTREIFHMSRFEHMKYKEIAEKLSISVKTVEANMGRALKTLRITLEAYNKRN